MVKKMKRVFCIHPKIHSKEELVDYLGLRKVDEADELIWDSQKPDYIFASEHIYLNYKCFNAFRKYKDRSDLIYIYIAGECIAPDMNIFDYACVFDRKLKDDDRIIRIPPLILHKRSIFSNSNDVDKAMAYDLLRKKRGFCCFIYSNRAAHNMRDSIFHQISKYKKVDSLGKHLRNVDRIVAEKGTDWRKESIEMKARYKFSIAAENASYEGYTSEKIFTSFQSHSIPIYWGNPYIKEEFNPDAFINVNDYSSFDALINRIKEIDTNDALWIGMISKPWQTDEQKKISETEIINYYSFWKKIFENDIGDIKRIPEGTYPDRYRDFFYRNSSLVFLSNSINKILRKIQAFLILRRLEKGTK